MFITHLQMFLHTLQYLNNYNKCVCVFTDKDESGGQRSSLGRLCQWLPPPYVLKQGLSINLKLGISSREANKPLGSTCLRPAWCYGSRCPQHR